MFIRFLTLLPLVLFFGCKNPQTSEFGLSSSPAFVPPPDLNIYKSFQSSGFGLAGGNGSSSGSPNATCSVDPVTGEVVCTPNSTPPVVNPTQNNKETEKPTPTPTPITNTSNEVKVFADTNGNKWFNEDRSSYYLPIKNNPDLVQHFNALDNKPTGWFFNKKQNRLVKPTSVDNPESLLKPDWKPSPKDQIYQMTYQGDRNTWKGEQQVYHGDNYHSTGLNYYYGNRLLNRSNQSGTSNSSNKAGSNQEATVLQQESYGHIYEIDTAKYRSANPDSQFSRMSQGSSGVLLTTVYPEGLDANLPLQSQSYSGDQLSNIFKPKPRVQATPSFGGGNSTGSSGQGTNSTVQGKDVGGGLKVILVSGIGCPPCQIEKPNARARGIPVQEFDMSRGNPYGVSSYPTYIWIDSSGQVVKRSRTFN